MLIVLDGQPVQVPSRVAAMILHLLDHATVIEAQKTGEVILDYAPWQVGFKLTVKSGLRRLEREVDTRSRN